MKLSKKLAFGCLVLFFALQFGGCSLFSGNSSEQPKTTESKSSDVKKRQQETTEKIKQLEQDLKSQETQTEREKTQCNLMLEQSKKSGKDPNDTKSETYKQCKKAEDSSKTLGETKEKLNQEKGNLETIKNELAANDSGENSGSKNGIDLWSLALWLVGGIVGLAVLGGLGWLAYSLLSNTFKQERESTEHGFKLARKDNQELAQKVNHLEQTVKLQSGQFTQIQTALQTLQRQIAESGGQNYQQQAIFTQPVYKPEPQFPTAAEDYLSKKSANAQTATADLIGGLLVNDSNKGNEFLIVRDNELPENLFYAVPNQTRFQTKSDYLNYYQNYYTCENPSGGAVWIKSPTTVKRVEGGWKLQGMGELEIR